MNIEIQAWSRRYEELKVQKTQLEKDSAALLKNMENNHLKAIEEIENLYEKKLSLENEKYLQLEQKLLEERMKAERDLKKKDSEYQDTIMNMKKEFEDQFYSAKRVYDSTKETADQLRFTYEERLAQQEEEHEMEVGDIKGKHKKEVEDLRIDLAKLKSKNDAYMNDNKITNEEKDRLMRLDNERQSEIENLNKKLFDSNNKIDILQKEIEEKEETIKNKDKKIYELKYKITDLQKAKHVLTFRTTELRKNLEPKEAQVEKMKEEIFKLENEFDGMLKTSQSQNEKIVKLNNQIESLTVELKKQVDLTKKKEAFIVKLTGEIYICVTSKDSKTWATEMKRIYHSYVLEEDIKKTHQDPKGIDEMTRQKDHLEKAMEQMEESAKKIIKRREVDIRKKTIENSQLIYQLNEIRKRNKEYEQEILSKDTILETMKNENTKMKVEIDKMKKRGVKGITVAIQ